MAALISSCGAYRYWLTRGEPGSLVTFVMLNPSTADSTEDDPTVRRCLGFRDLWGFSELAVVNLYALRSTDPSKLKNAFDPVGPDNARWQREFIIRAGLVICAWGSNAEQNVVGQFCENARRWRAVLYCLGETKSRMPRHPLYLRKDSTPRLWRGQKREGMLCSIG